MSVIDEALRANATIANDYDRGRGKPPAPRFAIVTCMDPRLTNIGQMLDLADGDADVIRNAGTVIDDDSVRSLVVSTRLLGSREIMIINHTDCGMLKFADSEMEDRLRKETGRAPIAPARFYSFTDVEENTREQIQKADARHAGGGPRAGTRPQAGRTLAGPDALAWPDGGRRAVGEAGGRAATAASAACTSTAPAYATLRAPAPRAGCRPAIGRLV